MKTILVLLSALMIISLSSCNNQGWKKSLAKEAPKPYVQDLQDEFDSLCAIESWEHASLITFKEVPDSMSAQVADYVIKLVSAASYHMAAGDYEDPEDVIEQAECTAQELFGRSVSGISCNGSQGWTSISQVHMTTRQQRIYELLQQGITKK